MADNNSNQLKTNIPALTETNFLQCSMCMTAYLWHKSLLKYATQPPVNRAGAVVATVATKHTKVVHILMTHIGKTVFETVITPDISKYLFGIWSSIK